jgi:hypothetical protein
MNRTTSCPKDVENVTVSIIDSHERDETGILGKRDNGLITGYSGCLDQLNLGEVKIT